MINIASLLAGRRSYVAFAVHDSLVIDLAKEDKDLISDIIKVFGCTEFGEYKVSVQAGKNFGELKKIL